MNLQKAFDPQISPIYADESGRYLVRSYHLPGERWTVAVATRALPDLRNLRNLRTERVLFA